MSLQCPASTQKASRLHPSRFHGEWACVQVYTPEKVQVLLQALYQEAFHIMLFLKRVQCIEVVEWQAGAASPVLQYTCRVQNASQQLQQSRGLFQHAAQQWAAAGMGTSQAGTRLSGLHIISFEGLVEGQPGKLATTVSVKVTVAQS